MGVGGDHGSKGVGKSMEGGRRLGRKLISKVVAQGGLPIIDYILRLHPRGEPFSEGRYIKGQGFHELKYRKG